MKTKLSFFFSKVLPVLLWLVVIYFLSSLPGHAYPKEPQIFSWTAHLAEYFVLGYLLARMFGKKGAAAFLLALAICLIYAASDEWHQSFVPGRVMDIVDWMFDGVGGIVGILGYYMRK